MMPARDWHIHMLKHIYVVTFYVDCYRLHNQEYSSVVNKHTCWLCKFNSLKTTIFTDWPTEPWTAGIEGGGAESEKG